MAETKSVQKASYPLPAYNFRVTVDGESMSFSEVSGIRLERGHVTYRHGLSFKEGQDIAKYVYEEYVPLTLKKGTVKGANALCAWVTERATNPRPLDVSLCDEQGAPVVTWHVAKAVAIKLEAPSFEADSNTVSIDSLEVMAAGISVEFH